MFTCSFCCCLFSWTSGGAVAAITSDIPLVIIEWFPERITLTRPDDEILSGYDEDASLHTRWVFFVGEYLVWAHYCSVPVETAGSAKPVYRGAHDRRQISPKPEYRFDNSVPNRLLEQRRPQHLELEPGASTRQRRSH